MRRTTSPIFVLALAAAACSGDKGSNGAGGPEPDALPALNEPEMVEPGPGETGPRPTASETEPADDTPSPPSPSPAPTVPFVPEPSDTSEGVVPLPLPTDDTLIDDPPDGGVFNDCERE